LANIARPGARSRVARIGGPALPYDRTYHLLGRLDKIRSRVLLERPEVLEAHSPYLATAAILACGRAARVRTAFWHADHVGTYIQPLLDKHLGARAADALTARLWGGGVRALLAPFDATFVAGRAQADRLRAAGVRGVRHTPFGVDARVFRGEARSVDRRREWTGEIGRAHV
jgi:alpha-1,6-mannosyltransferase